MTNSLPDRLQNHQITTSDYKEQSSLPFQASLSRLLNLYFTAIHVLHKYTIHQK